MLFSIPWRVRAKVFTNPPGMPANGVEFVVSQDHEGRALHDHSFDNMEGFPDLGAAIDNVPHKDGLTGTVMVGAALFLVPKLFQELFQDGGVAVDVADDVVELHRKFIKNRSGG